jgi:ElaB/YqjD/DUF883 family membrane-anchored ribosome-binding protein
MPAKTAIPAADTNGQTAVPTTDRAASGLACEFNDFIADVEDLVKASTSLTGEDLTRVREKLGKRVTAAKESIAAIGGEISDQARNAAKMTDGYVRKHPWQAVGIGAALGLLLGVTLARRK